MEPLFLDAGKILAGLVLKTGWEMGNKRIDEPLKQIIFNASRQYVQNYIERHGTLKVICVRMDAPVKLDEVFTPVQVLERSELRYFESADALQEWFREAGRGFEVRKSDRQDGIAVANTEQYLMVLGGPGVGKSTFLRKVGLEALKGRSKTFHHPCIPVFLRLQAFNSNQMTIVQLIEQEFATCGFPDAEKFTQSALQKGKLVVLLDGLDEVPTENLDYAITQIENLIDRYRQNRFIASCRTAAYKTGFRNFKDVAMAAFNDAQIEQFIHNWFRGEPQTAKECWELLKSPEYAAAKELAQTPLLLTLLCAVYDESQAFPKNRSAVYGEALDVLLKKWAAEKRLKRDPIYRELSPELEQTMLMEIACTSFAKDELFFSKQDVTQRIREFLVNTLNAPQHLDAEAVLNAIEVQQGILVERARDTYSFSHLTLQEYLTAQYIKEHHQIHALVQNHLTDEHWGEIFLLVAGLLRGGADEMLQLMEKHTQSFIQAPKLQALFDWADEMTRLSPPPYTPPAKRVAAIIFFIDLIRSRALDLDLATIKTLAFKTAMRLAIDPSYVMNRVRDRTRTVKLMEDGDLDIARNLEKLKLFSGVNFRELTSHLTALQDERPEPNQAPTVKIKFDRQVQQTWAIALKLDPLWLKLSIQERRELENYFYSVELMLRCKEQAVRVSPQVWAEIESRLVMPTEVK